MLEHIDENCEYRFGQSGRRDDVESRRDRQGVPCIDDRVLRVTPAAEQGRNFVANLPPAGGNNDFPSNFKASGLRRTGRRGIGALPLEHIGTVYARRANGDEDLARARGRCRDFDRVQGRGWTLAAFDGDCVHGGRCHGRVHTLAPTAR